MSSAEIGSAFDYEHWAAEQLNQIEQALDRLVVTKASSELSNAMRYAVLGGGKRLRPLLVLASAQAVGGLQGEAAMRAACAVELLHAYSLVHDDMPCMDNDVLRRGQPTVHVKFGQAMALLVGDALQALAFEVLTPPVGESGQQPISPHIQAQQVSILARAAGASGMAGGQAIDLLHVGVMLGEVQLQQMHQLKTGALLSSCVAMGIACAGDKAGEKVNTQTVQSLMHYAHNLGLAFQVVDDILDATAHSNVIGKTAGKDAHANKPTYVSILGLEAAKARAQNLYEQAAFALAQSGLTHVEPLQALARKIVGRSY